jgi:hypothetical protein
MMRPCVPPASECRQAAVLATVPRIPLRLAHDSFAFPAPFQHELGRPSVFRQSNK